MLIDIILLAFGLSLLFGGGSYLVRGASALAALLGVPPLVIGLTFVAFGTSAPELAINLAAAFKGSADISFGNIIGSNIANIGLIVSCAAFIKPLEIHSKVVTREIPMMILATAATCAMGFDPFLRGTPAVYDRTDGIILLLLFCVFLYYTVNEMLRKNCNGLPEEVTAASQPGTFSAIALNVLYMFGGLAALIWGGDISVDSAVRLAEAIAIPQAVIGLTVVAVGTSLPELVTSVIATWKGETDLAIGNVVGSNIFNLLLVMGVSSAINPVPLPLKGNADLLMMALISVILLPLAISDKFRIVRLEGVFLIVLYFGYIFWRTMLIH